MTSTGFVWLSLALAAASGAVPTATAVVQANDRSSLPLAIGALVHANEDGRWSVRQIEEGRRYIVGCHDRDCDGDLIDIAIAPASPDSCNEAFVEERAAIARPVGEENIRFSQIRRPGFTVEVALVELGCRNWTGSPVFARTAVGNDVYASTAYVGGCRETPPEFDKPVLEFLNGLTLRQN